MTSLLLKLCNYISNDFCFQTRLGQDNEYFLAVPHGLLYSEVTAANLIKVDMGGETLDSGTTGLGVNRAAFSVHAAVHASRPDMKCLVQLRNPSAVAVSSLFNMTNQLLKGASIKYVLSDEERGPSIAYALTEAI